MTNEELREALIKDLGYLPESFETYIEAYKEAVGNKGGA